MQYARVVIEGTTNRSIAFLSKHNPSSVRPFRQHENTDCPRNTKHTSSTKNKSSVTNMNQSYTNNNTQREMNEAMDHIIDMQQHSFVNTRPASPSCYRLLSPQTKEIMTPNSRTRVVRFAETTTQLDSQIPLYCEDMKDLWYGPEELFHLRQQTRSIVLACRMQKNADFPRGTEILGSEHRLRHRRMTLQCIGSAARKGIIDEKLAEISRQCTAWSAEIAVLQAIRDFAAVYPVPDQVRRALPSKMFKSMPAFPFAMRKRRRESVEDSLLVPPMRGENELSSRQVRRRIDVHEE
jgi:hypothetical protein